ncbi:LPS export ABC transporter periplasmic protein LptC, partial [Proteus mirabilis]|uniref:LPS export ABC transporter periplasmic protein LptC n=1 Tax=Proteus mirabilis TaxID=584 RepID=UPI0013D085C2
FFGSSIALAMGSVRSTSGMEFTTGRASYRASRQLVVTDDRVSFRDARFAVEGVGMEFLVLE